jgi:hypothetical protein
MDPKVLYWTGALLNMGVIVGLAAWGVRARRQGDILRHRRLMLGGIGLVLAFIGSYVVKLTFLGRENLDSWSPADLWTLRIHELCILTMVIAGGIAAWRGRRLAHTRNATHVPDDPPAPPKLTSGHRAAGWTAVAAVVLGFLTAGRVLAGMYQRAGLP